MRHLALELDDRKELTQSSAGEFLSLVRSEMGEPEKPAQEDEPGLVPAGEPTRGPEVPEDRPEEPAVEGGEPEPEKRPPDAVRKLWRAIAVVTHPDKVGHDGDRGKLYRRASAAWQEKNWSELVGVALELGLPIEPDQALYDALLAVRNQHQDQLDNIEDTALWQWIVAESDGRKAEIVREVSEQIAARKRDGKLE